MTTKPKAISYIRFSASHQGKGSSVERQRSLFDKWLLDNPQYESSELNSVDRGVSAFKGDHKKQGLGKVLEAVNQGLIKAGDALVIEAFDRLGREGFKLTNRTFELITEKGVDIHTLEDGRCYTEASSNTGDMYLLVAKFQAAHEYSKRLSERISAAYKLKKTKASEGLAVNAPNRPHWIDKHGKLIEGQQGLPLRVIDLYKQGKGQLSILKTIHEEFPSLDLTNEANGIASDTLSKTNRHPPLTTRSIKRLLTNEALIGYWNGIKAFDAILSIAEFNELQTLVKERTIPNKAAETYLLSGLLRCVECSGAYNFRTQAARATKGAPLGSEAYRQKGVIVYANCSGFLKSNRCSNSFTVPYEVAELVYGRTHSAYLLGLAQGKAVSALSNKETAELQAEYDLLNEQVNLYRNVYLALKRQSDLDELNRLNIRLETVQAKLDKQKQITADLEQLKAIPKTYTDDDFLNGTKEQQEFYAATQKAINELEANVVNLRNALKAGGYKIEAGRPKDGSSNGVLICEGNSYSIVRRSQLELCYIVSATETDEFGDKVKTELKARRKPSKIVLS